MQLTIDTTIRHNFKTHRLVTNHYIFKCLIIGVLSISLFACFENTNQSPSNSKISTQSNESNEILQDTYFSIAISDGSNAHSGKRLVLLDFQSETPDLTAIRKNVVIAPKIENDLMTIDGSAADWNDTYFTSINAMVQNNYPLSESVDAINTEITVGATWDDDNVYFLVQWEDAGHSRDIEYQKWTYSNHVIDGDQWINKTHRGVIGTTPPSPNKNAINRTHKLSGAQLDDQLMIAFPISDASFNYAENGLGCAAFCHIDWSTESPDDNYTGSSSATMYSAHIDDKLDVWHWSAGRSHHSGYSDDLLLYQNNGDSGFQADAGFPPYKTNNLANGAPQFSATEGINTDSYLKPENITQNNATPNLGDEIPFVISNTPTLSRADIITKASFDLNTYKWTVEIQRKRVTSNADDRQFEIGDNLPKPSGAILINGNVSNGKTQYETHCQSCHLANGSGKLSTDETSWVYPKVQRTSGSLILKALETVPAMNAAAQALGNSRQQRVQVAEDIAAYLQTLESFTPITHNVSIQINDSLGVDNIITSEPAGIDCPPTCDMEIEDLSLLKLTLNQTQQLNMLSWGSQCATTDNFCEFYVSKQENIVIDVETKPTLFSLNIGNSGNGRIQSTPLGVDCGLQCSGKFEQGTEITLTASPLNQLFQFDGWTGDICNTIVDDCVFTIESDTTISGSFSNIAN